MIGAMRADRWLTLGTCWGGANTERFTGWVQRRLVPRLRPGDIVVLDNLSAHKAPAVRRLIEGCGAMLQFLPPYSHDLNPIEAAWALIKKRIRSSRRGLALGSARRLSALIGLFVHGTADSGMPMPVTDRNSSDLWG